MELKIWNYLTRIVPALLFFAVTFCLWGEPIIILTGVIVGEIIAGKEPVLSLLHVNAEAVVYTAVLLFIREISRLTKRGWICIFLLCLAFAVFDSALLAQSYFGSGTKRRGLASLLYTLQHSDWRYTHWAVALSAIVGQTITRTTSIAVAEALSPTRPDAWLKTHELWIVGGFIAVSYGALFSAELKNELVNDRVFDVSYLQSGIASVAVIALIVAAFGSSTVQLPVAKRKSIAPVWCGVAVFVAVAIWLLLGKVRWSFQPEVVGTLILNGFQLFIATGTTCCILRESRYEGWNQKHVLSLAAGAVVALSLNGFTTNPFSVSLTIHFCVSGAFLISALAVVRLASKRIEAHSKFLMSEHYGPHDAEES